MERRKKTTTKKTPKKQSVRQSKTVQKSKKTRKNNKGITIKDIKENKKLLLIFLIILVLVIYCACKVIALIKNPTDTFTVEQGKIVQEESSVGYIIREETVVKGSNYKNGMVQIKTEGERVGKNEAIFRYYSSGEESLKKKIEDLDVKIDEAMEETMTGEKGILTSDIRTLEKQIQEKVTSLMEVNNLQDIREAKKDISNNITKKAKIAGDYSPAGSYLKKLIDERSKYENQLNKGSEYLKAPISGVVSYKLDGYEEILTPSNFSNLTKDTLNKLDIKTGQVVADSQEGGKIINNFKCYIACILDSEQAKNVKLDDKIKIRLPNNAEVYGTVQYISYEDNEVILVLELTEQVQELVSYRKISFDIIWWSHSGKKVPNSAIGTEQKGDNEVSYVVRTRAGYQDKIWIKVTKKNEKYSIVENYTNTELQDLGYSAEEINGRKTLTLYDEILKKPILND